MNIWEQLSKVDISNKNHYVKAFKNLIKQIQEDKFDFKDKELDMYEIINEKGFVYIIPNELKELFKEMKEKAPEDFLGFTVLVKDVRVSCFGIPCSELSKAIIS